MGWCSVHTRIAFGVVAWLLGAGTATAGSLLAVSLLGQGITGGSGQLLTQDAVNRALASEATQAPPPASPAVTASASPSPAVTAATRSPAAATAPPGPGPATTGPVSTGPVSTGPVSTAPATTAAAPPEPASGTVLTSPGGEVVAACPATGAYLVSWSPLQGYQVGDVTRGPAATARVMFESAASRVTMVVSCSAGVLTVISPAGAADLQAASKTPQHTSAAPAAKTASERRKTWLPSRYVLSASSTS